MAKIASKFSKDKVVVKMVKVVRKVSKVVKAVSKVSKVVTVVCKVIMDYLQKNSSHYYAYSYPSFRQFNDAKYNILVTYFAQELNRPDSNKNERE